MQVLSRMRSLDFGKGGIYFISRKFSGPVAVLLVPGSSTVER